VKSAKTRLEAVRRKLKGKDALLAEMPDLEYRVALFELGTAGDVDPTRTDFAQELKDVGVSLDALNAGRSALAARRGDFRRAYRSAVDGTLQPYRVYVPTSYDASKEYPLVIALHGMGGNESSYFDGYQRGSFKVEAEKRGYLVACPKGRLPASMYMGSAEKDVLDVVAEMRKAYRVDPSRIYLTGHSMGGFGTWSVAMDHPEIWAALAPISGGGNPAGMVKIARIPQIVVHGDNDKTVPVERSRVMVEAGKKAGTEIKYLEVPGGSHISVAAPAFKDIFDWFDGHKRAAAAAAN
jgi:poly(3-hydroxybutyrate) depolymerase